MWPREKKSGLDLPKKAPYSSGEMRTLILEKFPGRAVTFDGPFPIADEEGRFLCKGCGVPYDEFSLADALPRVREGLRNPGTTFQVLHFNCRKCGSLSIFTPRDALTLRPGDPFGPWNSDEAGSALATMHFLGLSADEIEAMPFDHIVEVLNLYQG